MAMPQPQFVTQEEIRQALRAKGHEVSTSQLRAWVTKGLLPKHTRVVGRGRRMGVQPVYPASAIGLTRRIVEMRDQGLADDEIRRRLEEGERQFAHRLIQKHLDFHRILSPGAQAAWTDWVTNMAERIRDWSLTDEQKEERVHHIAAIHLREFRLILDTVDSRLREKIGSLDPKLEDALAEIKRDVEAEIEQYPLYGGDRFQIPPREEAASQA